jgi:hypothetical protein
LTPCAISQIEAEIEKEKTNAQERLREWFMGKSEADRSQIMPSLKKGSGKHAQKGTATGTTPSVRPPVRKRKSSESCRAYCIRGKVVDFLLRSTDRVFTEGGINIVSEQCGEKLGF